MKNSETAYRLKTKLKKILGLSLLFRLVSIYLYQILRETFHYTVILQILSPIL